MCAKKVTSSEVLLTIAIVAALIVVEIRRIK